MIENKYNEEYSDDVKAKLQVIPNLLVEPRFRATTSFIPVSYTSPSVRKRFEVIRSDNSRPHTAWKPCQHYLRAWKQSDVWPSTFAWTTRTTNDIGGWMDPNAPSTLFANLFPNYGDETIGPDSWYVPQADGSFIPQPSGLDGLVDRSIRSMLPHIKAELSLVNSIYELKDFVSLPRTLNKMANLTIKAFKGKPLKLGGLFGQVRSSFTGKYKPTLREYYRGGADGFLQTKFNILPLVSDVCGVYTALARAQKITSALIRDADKRRLKRFTYEYIPSELENSPDSFVYASIYDPNTYGDPVNGPLVYGGVDTGFQVFSRSVTGQSVFHAQMEYSYSFSKFQKDHAWMLTLLDSMGVNMNPAILWNALPWSFVVDWVANVSSYLENFKVLNMEPQIVVSRYMWSVKKQRLRRRWLKSYQSTTGFGSNTVPIVFLPTVFERSYIRSTGIPYHSPAFLGSGVSLGEAITGSVLATTRGRSKPLFRRRDKSRK